MSKLIGLTGRLGSGKDAANVEIARWCDFNDLTHARRGFADKLKQSAAHALGFHGTVEECVAICDELKRPGVEIAVSESYAEHHPEVPGGANEVLSELITKISGREFLQLYGTEAHRDVFGQSFWVDALLPLDEGVGDGGFLGNNFNNADVCVVTDVRFPNEAERIRKLGGVVVKVRREAVEIEPVKHASEAGVADDLVSHELENHGTIPELGQAVDKMLEHLVARG